jgi:predicted transcriptional regulator
MLLNIFKKIYYEKYSKKSYAISNVDLIIDRMFSNKKKGIYVDVGCNHPIKFNNTYLLYKRGWNGINIDLDNDSIKQFNKLRKRDVNIKTLVTSFDGEEKNLYFYHNRSAINTISKTLADKRINKHKEIKTIKGTSLNSIIEKSKYKNSNINLLTIDIENYEYDALKNFNFEQYNVDVIVAEITDTEISNLETYNQSIDFILKSNLYKLLIKKNYRLVNWVNADLIFVNKNNNL